MKSKEKKRYVCLECMKNEQGTTFISVLISLFCIVITMPLIIHFLTFIHTSEADDDLAFQYFYIFIRNDALTATDVYIDENNRMYFYLPTGEIAKVEQYRDVIRRRVDEKGHEIYIRNIEDFSVQLLAYGIKIIITTEKGKTYEKTIATYK